MMVAESDVDRTSDGGGDEPLWPMGAVSRRIGIGEHTLRAWERRFGFPEPVRLPSGHRRYPADQVRQLVLINEALKAGYRAGDVVPLSRERLAALLDDSGRTGAWRQEAAADWLGELLGAARRLDRETIVAGLRRDAVNLGVARFLRERVEPALVAVGEAWSRSELEIRHEHFLSAAVEDVLRTLRAPLEAAGRGRPVVLASLPDELHTLGLQIAALAIAAADRALRLIGAHTPVDEIVEAAVAVDAAAVGLTVSQVGFNEGTVGQISSIRERLPTRIRLWIGGAGSRELDAVPPGVEALPTLDDLERALRTLDG